MTAALSYLFFYGRVLLVGFLALLLYPLRRLLPVLEMGLLRFANGLFRPVADVDSALSLRQNYEAVDTSDFFTLCRKVGLTDDWFRGKHLLDVGCGSAKYTMAAVRRGATRIDGFDIDADRIAFAQQAATKEGVTAAAFQVMSVYEIKFPDNHFDGAISHAVFEHLPDLPGALKEIARVLRPGAQIVITHDAYRARYGAHLHRLINVPWPAVLFSAGTLRRFWAERLAEVQRAHQLPAPPNLLQIGDGFDGINRLRISEVIEMMRASPLRLLRAEAYAEERPLLRWPGVRAWPALYEHLRGSGVFLLEKPRA